MCRLRGPWKTQEIRYKRSGEYAHRDASVKVYHGEGPWSERLAFGKTAGVGQDYGIVAVIPSGGVWQGFWCEWGAETVHTVRQVLEADPASIGTLRLGTWIQGLPTPSIEGVTKADPTTEEGRAAIRKVAERFVRSIVSAKVNTVLEPDYHVKRTAEQSLELYGEIQQLLLDWRPWSRYLRTNPRRDGKEAAERGATMADAISAKSRTLGSLFRAIPGHIDDVAYRERTRRELMASLKTLTVDSVAADLIGLAVELTGTEEKEGAPRDSWLGWTDDSFVFRTKWVELEDQKHVKHQMGRFDVELKWSWFRGAGCPGPYPRAVDPHKRRGREYTHPHIMDPGYLCMGNAAAAWTAGLNLGQVAVAARMAIAVLNSYRPEQMDRRLEFWDAPFCRACGGTGVQIKCATCGEEMCAACGGYPCSECGKRVCEKCASAKCSECRQAVCKDCQAEGKAHRRPINKQLVCRHCTVQCKRCEKKWPRGALPPGWNAMEALCGSCVREIADEQKQKQEQAAAVEPAGAGGKGKRGEGRPQPRRRRQRVGVRGMEIRSGQAGGDGDAGVPGRPGGDVGGQGQDVATAPGPEPTVGEHERNPVYDPFYTDFRNAALGIEA